MPKLSINLAEDFSIGTGVHYSESPQVQTLSKNALFWLAVILASGCALVAILGADDAHAHDMHVNKTPKPGLPYCGTASGMATDDDKAACFLGPAYPAPRFTNHGWNCPTQYHLAGRKGALRCDEET